MNGVVDVMKMKAIYFDGADGDTLREEEVPADLKEAAEAKRAELIETVSEVRIPMPMAHRTRVLPRLTRSHIHTLSTSMKGFALPL